jgi:hypothetical protein
MTTSHISRMTTRRRSISMIKRHFINKRPLAERKTCQKSRGHGG